MYPYVGELLTTKTRSNVLVIFGFGVGVGMLLTAAIGYLVKEYGVSLSITESYSITPWRIQMLIHLLPGLASFVVYIKLPESPKFLISTGKSDQALQVLKYIHQTNCNGKEAFPIHSLNAAAYGPAHSTSL